MTTLLILFTLFALPAILSLFIIKSSKPDRIMSKYLLRDFEKQEIKAKLTATPDNPCKDENEWHYHIHKLRNGKI